MVDALPATSVCVVKLAPPAERADQLTLVAIESSTGGCPSIVMLRPFYCADSVFCVFVRVFASERHRLVPF